MPKLIMFSTRHIPRSLLLAVWHTGLSVLISIIHLHKTIRALIKPDTDLELSKQGYLQCSPIAVPEQ